MLKEKISFFPELNQFIEKEYSDPKDLANDLKEYSFYSINFNKKVSANFIENGFFEENKILYLFEIYNKDFSA